jgi:hypothetical protein
MKTAHAIDKDLPKIYSTLHVFCINWIHKIQTSAAISHFFPLKIRRESTEVFMKLLKKCYSPKREGEVQLNKLRWISRTYFEIELK